MLESLRGLGYAAPTAIADIVDNSISANCSLVDINIHWAGSESWIRIIDDGDGMDDASLEMGMRLGARDPRQERNKNDLGRFGLGLKTASFSQARRLTVASKMRGKGVVCLRWDLDLLGTVTGADWPLFEGAAQGSEHLIAPLREMESGTIVILENLDRIVTDGFTSNDMIELCDRLEVHLGMVFHRLIGLGNGLKIRVTGKEITAWDPYLIGHPGKALESSEYRLAHASGVQVQCHVLPHRDLLKPEEIERAAGPNGWVQHQGFFVYRNKRLLLAGGWLGLGDGGRQWPRDEFHRLARIRLDIPNSADAAWKINVLKSVASPPVKLRAQLHRLATETREKARQVFAHRGHTTPATRGPHKAITDAWLVRKSTKGTSYKIDRDHDLVASILDRAGPLKADIVALLRLVEETVPVQRIWLDTAEDKETPVTGFTDAPKQEIVETLNSMFEALIKFKGLSEAEAKERLARTHPFDRYTDLIAQLSV